MPYQNGAPVMTDKDGLFKTQGIQQPVIVTGQTMAVIGGNRFRPAGMAVAPLVRRYDVIACVRQHRYLVPPAKGMLRPAVGQHHRDAALPRLKHFKLNFPH